jgi:hypothetical protein
MRAENPMSHLHSALDSQLAKVSLGKTQVRLLLLLLLCGIR